MMTTNLFAIANVKQLQTYVVLEFNFLCFQTSWCVGVLNSAIFFKFSQSGWVWQDFWRSFGISGGFEHPKPPLGKPLFISQLMLDERNIYLHRYLEILDILDIGRSALPSVTVQEMW